MLLSIIMILRFVIHGLTILAIKMKTMADKTSSLCFIIMTRRLLKAIRVTCNSNIYAEGMVCTIKYEPQVMLMG